MDLKILNPTNPEYRCDFCNKTHKFTHENTGQLLKNKQ
jgi:hypothetical protein